ncbi:cytochrome c [Roseomonas sp. E05]|uniref:c-type cytochrome n=1 Tax=Roseomonas sp. E05 TaxID=3046310 RepID=UPI0024BB8A45|nr:cytochrome c [Roseomonas sp. E05]MDJ0390522.1 cytochrome c [Roseomonas sp. E05]
MLRRLAALVVLALGVSALLPAVAQMREGDAEEGRRIAATWCSNCHITGERPPRSAADAAPSFRSIAARPSTDAASLHAFLSGPHGAMPDFQLSRAERDAVAAFILSLRGE